MEGVGFEPTLLPFGPDLQSGATPPSFPPFLFKLVAEGGFEPPTSRL